MFDWVILAIYVGLDIAMLALFCHMGWWALSTRRERKRSQRQARERLFNSPQYGPEMTPDEQENERLLMQYVLRKYPRDQWELIRDQVGYPSPGPSQPTNSGPSSLVPDGPSISGSKPQPSHGASPATPMFPLASHIGNHGPSVTTGSRSASSKSGPFVPAGTDGGSTSGWMNPSGRTPSPTRPSPGASTSTPTSDTGTAGDHGRAAPDHYQDALDKRLYNQMMADREMTRDWDEPVGHDASWRDAQGVDA